MILKPPQNSGHEVMTLAELRQKFRGDEKNKQWILKRCQTAGNISAQTSSYLLI